MRWKKLLIAVAAILVVLMAVVYVFVSIYDFNRLKPVVAQTVQDATGRKLTISGDIDLKLGVSPTLSAEDIRFQNAPWGSRPDLAKARRIDLQIALWPLIRGHFEFIRLSLLEPDIIVEINNEGTSNVEFGLLEDEDDSEFPVLILNDLHIENGILTYHDIPSGQVYSSKLKHLDAVIPGFEKPIQLDLEGAFENTAFTLDGTIGPIMAWFEPGHFWPADLTANVGGTVIRLNGEIRDPINFRNLHYTLTAAGSSTAAIARLAGQDDMADLGPFKFTAEVTDPDGKLGARNLDLRLGSGDPIAVLLNGSIRDLLSQQGIDLGVVIKGDDVSNLTKLALEELNLNIGTREILEVNLSGEVKNLLDLEDIHLNFRMQSKNLANLEKIIRQPMPVRGPFSAVGKVIVPDRKHLQIPNLTIICAKNKISGSLGLDISGKKPKLSAKLASNKFSLTSLLSSEITRQTWVKAIPDNEPIKLNIQLSGFREELSVEKVDFEAGTEKQAKLKLNGAIYLSMVDGKTDSKYLDLLQKYLGTNVVRLLNPFKTQKTYTEVNCMFNSIEIMDGLAVFFSDVSLGKKDPCLQAAEKFEKEKEAAKTKKTEKNK